MSVMSTIGADGTIIPFNPPSGQDIMMKSGVMININTKHQCITAMKEYENKSLEELHMEDYRANRKSKHASSTSTVSSNNQTPRTQANAGFSFGCGQNSGFQTSTMGLGGFRTSTDQTGSSVFGINIYSLFGHKYLYVNCANIAVVGTTVPFNPPNGEDTMMKSGVTMNIITKHQCITAMNEYKDKSLEELRFEDYSANRKLKQAGSTSTVGSNNQRPSTQATTGFSFGGGQRSGVPTSTMGSYNQTLSKATAGFSFGSSQGSGFQTSTVGSYNQTPSKATAGFSFGSSQGSSVQTSTVGSYNQTPVTQATAGFSFGSSPGSGVQTSTLGFESTSRGGLSSIIKPARFGTSTGIGTGDTPLGFETGLGTGTTTNTFVIPAAKPAIETGNGNCKTTGTSGRGLCSIIKPARFNATSAGNGTEGTSCGFETGPGAGTTTNTFVITAAKPAVETDNGNCESTGELIGIKSCNTNEMQKDIPCLNINSNKIRLQKKKNNLKKMQPIQLDKGEHFENAQSLDNCLQTGQECITNKEKDKQLLTDKQKAIQTLIQTVIESQADIEESNGLIQKIIKEQKEINDKHEKQLEKLTAALHNIFENFQALANSTGVVQTEAVDNKQFSDVQRKFEILEVNSENVRCNLDDYDTRLQELAIKVEEDSKNVTPIPELKNLQKAEDKINAFEEEWSKNKEEVGKLYNDFEIKNTILCQIIADRLAPLQELRHIFKMQLDVAKDNVKKLDTVCDQMTDLLPKFLQHESKCEKLFVGFIVHNTLTSQPVANSVVYFSKIIADFGHNFDIGSGTFTSPVDGLYAVSLKINGDKDVETSIVKQLNGRSVLNSLLVQEEIILGKITTTNSFTANAFIVVDLKAGDGLCVKYGPVETHSSLLRDSTFTCFRIG
ncbi:hypothetical protein BsWGS_23375 [Bradybaena similaris]